MGIALVLLMMDRYFDDYGFRPRVVDMGISNM